MKVILLEDVVNVGRAGTVAEVADGHGRNFLIPRKLALPATPGNMKNIEKTRTEIAKKQNRLKSEAQNLAKRLEASPLSLTAHAGEEGRLHGSITTQHIADALAEKGVEVDKRKIHLDEPIKVLGSHTVKVKLAPDVEANLIVEVVPEPA